MTPAALAGQRPPAGEFAVRSSAVRFTGAVLTVRSDVLAMPDGRDAQRDFVVHPGAVAVVALRGEPGAEEVLLVRQYRHPVGQLLWELPAGLLDKPGEPASETAVRELAEEAHLAADTWGVLVDTLTSPGGSDEAVRVFLARDVRDAQPDGDFVAEGEESSMTTAWVPLSVAVDAVLGGALQNALACVGLLAADRSRAGGFSSLRPVTSPWPARPAHAG